MKLDRPARLTLQYLFSEYKKGPAVVYSINGTVKKSGIDPIVLSEYLLEKGWIRERWIYSENVVACRITIAGIEKIDPIYVRTKMDQIVGTLVTAGSSLPLLDILEQRIEDFSIASDFVSQMERLGLVKITNPGNSIVVELTDLGWKYGESRSSRFLTLVA